MNWIDFDKQQFPTQLQHFKNYEQTLDNVFLGVVCRKDRRGRNKHVVEPVLFCNSAEIGEYWTDIYGDCINKLMIKWAMMPDLPK